MSLFWCIIIYGDRMENKLKKIVNILKDSGKTISTMESCTGGAIVSAITNVPGASTVLNFSAVTYSNDFKVKMGVDKDIIDKYTVYSKETAIAMARAISTFANADYGVGITGRFGVIDPANLGGKTDIVYVSIYDKQKNKDNVLIITSLDTERSKNKDYVIAVINKKMSEILKKKNETKALKRIK